MKNNKYSLNKLLMRYNFSFFFFYIKQNYVYKIFYSRYLNKKTNCIFFFVNKNIKYSPNIPEFILRAYIYLYLLTLLKSN